MAEEVSRHLAFFNWAEEDIERRRQGMPAANFHFQRVLSVRKTCILGSREGGRIARRRFQTQLTSADKNAATTNAREENGENWARGFQRWNSLCCRWDHVTRSSGISTRRLALPSSSLRRGARWQCSNRRCLRCHPD